MYEDYMQNYLGYPGMNFQNTYDMTKDNNQFECGSYNPYSINQFNYSRMNEGYYNFGYQNTNYNFDIEGLYPDIYNIVYPMIKKACMKAVGPVTKEIVDSIVDDVYNSVGTNERIELNINLNNEVRTSDINEDEIKTENRASRQNNFLRDVILILTIRELLNRPRCRWPNCPRPMPRPGMGNLGAW